MVAYSIPQLNLFGYTILTKQPRPMALGAKFRDGGRKGKADRQDLVSRPMFTSQAFRLEGAVDPTPDISYPLGSLSAATGRLLADPPEVDINTMGRLMAFTKKKAPSMFSKLPDNKIYDLEEWLSLTSYTSAQKDQLRALFNEHFPDSNESYNAERRREILLILSFIKKEFYPSFKMYRAILGRNDLAKLLFGALVKSIESIIYESPYLVKHVPWHERPAFMRDKFQRFTRFINGDFSSFEASIRVQLAEIERIIYSHVTNSRMANKIMDAFFTTNELSFSWFSLSMKATRASGDVTTALGNALICLFVWLFILEESDIKIFDLVVEGDDNQVGDNGLKPIKEEIFKQLGLLAKIEYPESYSKASFCGMIFDEMSDNIATDPIKVLNRFGWIDSKYSRSKFTTKLALYRGKALCNLYQYRNCPILESFHRAVLRATRKHTAKVIINSKHHLNNEYVPTDEKRLPPRGTISPESRILMEETFKIDTNIQQLYEQFFDSQHDLFDIPDFLISTEDQRRNWHMHVSRAEERLYPQLPFSFNQYILFANKTSEHQSQIIDFKNMVVQKDDTLYQFDPVSRQYRLLPTLC